MRSRPDTAQGGFKTQLLPLFIIIVGALSSCGGGGGGSNESVSATQTIDQTPPVITVTGSSSIDHQQGSVYRDEGASAVDSVDGFVTPQASGTVGDALGTYTITYTATDSAGNSASATRTVTVVAGTDGGGESNTGTGRAIDSEKWFHQTRLPDGNTWYNGEIQHYTDRIDNAYVSGGSLKIVAKKESFIDQERTKQYTSARLNSKYAFTYGRVEVRAKLPQGAGTWPAIWMLGKNINEPGAYWQTLGYGTTAWPASGEVDIMEHWGDNQNTVSSAIHSPSSYGGTMNVGSQYIGTVSSEFHVYSLDWTADQMVFSVDGVEHYTYAPNDKNASTWPFDTDQYLLLNFAIEGDIASNFTEGAMEVDYVRVYAPNSTDNPVWSDEFND